MNAQINECPAGSFLAGTLCQECAVGSYSFMSNSLTCESCSAGTFQNVTGQSSCTLCPPGTSSLVVGANSSSVCKPCKAGTFSSYSSCTICYSGSWSDAGASSCTGCLPGTFSKTYGANSSAACQKCPIGTYSNAYASQCNECYPGTFSNMTGSEDCTPCPAGSFSTIPAANSSSVCQKCPVGMYSKQGNSACAFCYEGTFADKPGTADECSPCPGGTFSPRFGANSSSTCERCPIGSYSYPSSSSCSFCNEGTYQNRTGQGFCYFCPGGTYSDVIGANSSSVCQPCAIGYFAKEGSSSCLTCYAGSYSNRTKARDCIGCPPGTFSTAIAANSSSTCQKCPIGTFAQKPGSSLCALCPRGSFAPATGLSSCISCPVGFTTNFTGSNSSGECIPCWGDTTNSGDDDDVSYDDDNTLNSFCVVGSATATPTASGTTSKTASSSRSSSASATISPSASLTMTSSAVPSSTVSPTPSSSSSTSFRPKPPVTMTPTSSAYPSFSSSTAPSISASASASSSASATASATATISLIKDNALSQASISPSSSATHSQPPSQSPSSTASSSITSSQIASSIATTSSTASPSATASTPSCPQGFILTNQSICEACPAGFYLMSNSSSSLSSSEGTTNTCTPCPSGYVSEKGQSECKPCNAGSFASGPSTCTPCAVGTYSSYAGYGTNCTLCDVGTYVNTTGATSCIACDPRTLCPAGSAVPGPCLFCGDSSSSTTAVLNSISNVTTTKEATEALLTISAVANFFRLASNASTSNNGTISNSSSADVIAAETAFRSAVIAQLENIVNVIASSSSIPQNISDMNSTQFAILLNDTSIPMTAEVSSALASDLKALTANPKQVTEDSAKSSLNTISTLLALSLPVNVQSGAVDAAVGGGGFDASSVNTIPPLPSKTATDFLSAISNVLSSDAVAALSVTNSSTISSLPKNGKEGGGGGGEPVVNPNEQQKDRDKAAAATAILSQISTALNKLSAAVLRSATVGAAPVSIVSAPVGSVFNSSSSTVQSFCGPALSMTVQRISTAASSVNANNSSNLTSSSLADEALLSVPLTAPLSPCLATSSLSSSTSSALGSIRRRLSNVVTSVRPSISANGAFLRSATTSSSSSIDVSFVQNGLSPVPQSIGFSSIGGPNTTVVDASSPLDTRVVSVTFLTRSGQKVDVNDAASPLVLELPLLNPSIQSESSLLVYNYEKRVFNISCPGRLSSPFKSVSATMFVLPTTSTLSGLFSLKQEVALSVLSTSASGSSTVSVPCDAPIGNRSFVCSPGDSQSSFSSPYSVSWTCPSLSLVPVCAFWNETLNEWSSAGCVVIQSGGGSISCACNHTTNFAARFTALADQQKVIFTGEKIRENPITLLKQYPYVFILVGGIALFTVLSLLVAYDLDQEAAARYYQSLKNDPEVQFLERIETLKGNVFVLDSVIDKHILLLQDKITRARLEAEASALAKKSGRYYLGHREILPADIFINKTTWSFPVPDGFIFRLRSGLCCKKRGRTALSVTTKEGQEELRSLASVDNPLLALSSSSSSSSSLSKNGTSSVDMYDEGSRINKKPTSPSNAEITIISKNPINSTSALTSTPHESMIQRQLTWLQGLTDKYTSDLYVRFEHVFDRFSITASHEVIELSKKAGLSSAIVDVVKESQQEMASQFPMLSKKNKETSETDSSSSSSPSSIHLDEVKGSIFSRIASLRGFLFRTWFLQVVFTHPLLSLFTKHDPRNPRYFRTIRLAAVMIGSLWTPILFYGFLHGNTSGTSSTKKESLGQLELVEMIVLAAMSSAVQVPISTVLTILLVGAGKAEFNKRYPFIAAELRRRAKVEDELCKMSKPLLEAELRALLQDETDLDAMKKLPNDQGNKLLDDVHNDHNNKDTTGFVDKVSADKDSSVIVEKVSVNENNDLISSNSSSIIIDASSSSSSPPINSAVHSASEKDLSIHGKELFAYGWIDAPPEVQQQCPSLLRLCGRHPSQKAAYVAKALKAEEERHAILKDKLKLKKKVAVMNKANKRSAQARERQSSFVASNAAVSAIGTALVVGNIDDHTNDQEGSGIHADNHTDDNENDDDDNDVDNIGGSDSNENTVDDMLDGDINSTDIFTFFMSAITMISTLCCARSTSVVNQSVMSMVSKRDVRAGTDTNSASKQRAGGQLAVKVAKNGKQGNGGGGVDRDSIASIYKLASEGTSKIVISHSPMTIQTFSALSLFVVIVSFWLFYIAQFGFNNSAETTLSIVFVWLFNQAFSLFIVEPMLTGVNVIVTFVLLPAILPHILWIPSVGSAVAGKVACDLANKDGRSVLSGRMENLTLVRAAGAASMLSPEASVVAYGIGAVLSATMSRIGGESLLQQRNGRASGGRSNDDAFHELTETQRNDLIVRRYVLAQLNAAEKAQRRKNNLAKRLVLTVSASRTLKERVLGRTLISETKGRQGKSRNTSHPSHSNVVVCDEAGLDQVKVPASICGICGEIERGSNVVDNDYIGDFCRCNSSSNSSTDDNDISGEQGTEEVPVRGQCPVCGEDEKLFEEEEGDFCSCNVEL